MRRLPPFAELVAFEAVARHRSFTRAAAELCVTQSAISHRVRRLEKHFGTQLIRRLNPGIALTDAGAALLPELAAVLDALTHLGGRRERRLRVAAGSALCTWWLAGRLSAFMQQRPGISVELVPIETHATSIPEVDVRILWVGAGQDTPSPTQAPLFSEHVFPVCSPRLLPNEQPLRDSRALASMPLLHKATHLIGEWSWQVWLDRLAVGSTRRAQGELRFADMGLILSAAVEGSGVALAFSLPVHDALQAGRLMIPVAGVEPMVSTKRYVARWRRARVGDPDIEAFVAWLVAEASTTIAETEQLLRAPPSASKKYRAIAGTRGGRSVA
jgi:LysR family transcriptional regulator, glycine cleavage system transcriptional activator